MEQIEDTLTV